MAPPSPIRPQKLAALALAPYFRSTAINNKTLKTCRYRHCEERSNLVNAQVITLRQIASFLAMTALDFLYDVQTGLRVMPALLSLLLLFALPIVAESGDMDMTVPTTVKTESDCDKAAILDLRVVYEDESLAGLVAPPAGVYPFEPGDGVVLRAYGMGDMPVSITWSGDASGTGETLYVDMDECKHIIVTFSRALQWPEKEAAPWFDVTENKNFYAFLGGGDLYGWFIASRDKTKGAGITHLAHKKAFLTPVLHFPSLNFEHVFSGAVADNNRSSFTPRTDPMRFCIEGPGMARVHWPAEGASWNMESEMIYRFNGKDAIDIRFSATFGEEAFPQGYAGFMWASYQSNFNDHSISFPGISDGQHGWVEYGPTIAEDQFGGTVTFQNVPSLSVEDGASAFNIIASENTFFTAPVYYGLLDLSIPKSKEQTMLTYAMMFDQQQPIRFAVWNWGDPPEISAWDWQYVASNPQPGKQVSYRARMVCAELDAPAEVSSRYEEWCELLNQEEALTSCVAVYPEMPIYWSPASILFDPLVVGECIERKNPDQALKLYREVLLTMDDAPRTAARMDDLLYRNYGNERRIDEWLYIREHRTRWLDSALPLLHLGKAYHANGDIGSALETLQQGLAETPDNAPQLLFYGELLIMTSETVAGLESISRAVTEDPELASEAGAAVASYAELALNDNNPVQAETLYRGAIAFAPQDHWYKVHLGEMLEQQGREEEAGALYRDVLVAAPESPYTAQLVDSLYNKREDVAGRIQFWRNILDQQPEAIVPTLHLGMAYFDDGAYEAVQATLAQTSDNTDIRFYLGASQLWLDEVDAGITLIEDAVANDPVLAEQAATAFATRAAQAMKANAFALAEKLYRKAVALVPNDMWYPVYLGEALEKQGKDEEALRLFSTAIHAKPEDAYIANLIHTFFVSRKDTVGCTAMWQKITDEHPDAVLPQLYLVRACYEGGAYARAVAVADGMTDQDNPELTLYRCGSLLFLDEVEEGTAALVALAKTEPDYASPIGAAFAVRAEKAAAARDYSLAERLYRNATTVAPDDLWHAIHLGETLEKLHREEEAVILYTQVLVAVQDAPRTAALLDALLVRAFSVERRISVWTEIQKQSPEAALPLLYLGKAYEAAENNAAAVEAYESALKFDASLTEAADALRRLGVQ